MYVYIYCLSPPFFCIILTLHTSQSVPQPAVRPAPYLAPRPAPLPAPQGASRPNANERTPLIANTIPLEPPPPKQVSGDEAKELLLCAISLT